MEPYILDRNFLRRAVLDGFDSLIWTERYYGDSGVEIVVPATEELIAKLPLGTFLSLDNSSEIMILESLNIEKEKLKLTGISLLKWLDNRFIRTTSKHADKYWYIENQVPGQVLWTIVYNMCCQGSPYLNGSIPTGVVNPQQLIIPGLGLRAYDTSGTAVKIGVPFGPVYAALREIANTYEIGMQITLDAVSDVSYTLGFRSYKGLDYTSAQVVNPVVRFSPHMDSFTDIKEVQSIAKLKTLVYSFAPGLESPVPTTPGIQVLSGTQYTGFDLRAQMTFEDDITTDTISGSLPNLISMLNSRALDELVKNKFVKSVDGEIVPESQFQYGEDYYLGDIIEVEGNTGVIQPARITEYIRSQDSAGEKSYPTVTIID